MSQAFIKKEIAMKIKIDDLVPNDISHDPGQPEKGS
jgi:hypothetical protein